MKKVLIIEYRQHNSVGGIETYVRNLIKVFKKEKWDITEIYLFKNRKKSDKVDEQLIEKSHLLKMALNGSKISFPEFIYMELSKLKIKKIDFSEYDLIINNVQTKFNFPKIYHNKIVQVQHWSDKYTKNFFKSLNKNLNVVLFDEINQKYIDLKKDTYTVALPYSEKIKKENENDAHIRKDLLYIGRLTRLQKNIPFLLKVSDHTIAPITVYGYGRLEKALIKKENIDYKGVLKSENLKNVLNKAKCFILVSNFEGFSFVLVESLSNGVPIIVRNTFPSAKFLVDNGKNGILVDKNTSAKEFAKIINNFYNKSPEEIEQYSKNCINFANKHLSYDTFQKKWTNIANTIVNKKSKFYQGKYILI